MGKIKNHDMVQKDGFKFSGSPVDTWPPTGIEGYLKKDVTSAGYSGPAVPVADYDSALLQAVITAVSTPVGATVKLQGSVLGGSRSEVWFDISSAVSITALGSVVVSLNASYNKMPFRFIRAVIPAFTSGTFSVYLPIVFKDE